MKTNKLLKGFFTCAMAATLVFGILHVSAQPAEALQCPQTLFGNTFSHIQQTNDNWLPLPGQDPPFPPGYNPNPHPICCCIYVTPSGQFVEGPSWYC